MEQHKQFIIAKLEQSLKLMRKSLTADRSITYIEGSVGFTSLLYCPLKVSLRKDFPHIEAASTAVDDGFVFEKMFEKVFPDVFKGAVVHHEPDVTLRYKDLITLNGHPDFVIEYPTGCIVLEFKAPVFSYHTLDRIPKYTLPENSIIYDDAGDIILSKSYIDQAHIQKYACQEFYKKPVAQYIFAKTMILLNGRFAKIYVIKPITSALGDGELDQKIMEFKYNKYPRYPWECSYCNYKKFGACKGKFMRKDDETKSMSDQTKHTYLDYVYHTKQAFQSKEALKKLIEGNFEYDGKKLGWQETCEEYVPIEDAYALLGDKLFKYLNVKDTQKTILLERLRKINPDKIKTRLKKEFVLETDLF